MAGYGEDNGFTTWLADNGQTLPEGAPAVAVLRQRGSTYVDGLYEPRLPGARAGGFAQERAWPRTGSTFQSADIPSDVVPVAWVQASYAAAYYEATNPGGLSAAVTAAGAVKRERVEGAVEVEYFQGSGSAVENATVVLSSVEGLVAPFFTKPLPAIFAV